jgi:hypothetical protein
MATSQRPRTAVKSKINRDYEDFSPNIMKDESSRYIDHTVMVE